MPIYSKEFLQSHIRDFRLSSITNLQRKKQILENWVESLHSKKLEYFKEEEIKSRFIIEIFGEVLGYNYKNASKWNIREEYKSGTDATKADAAIGSFHIYERGIANDVHIVIEIKNLKTVLEKPQNRKAFKLSPVDQGFLYATKAEGDCKWVVVSNFKEIRFYRYQSQSEFQQYMLEDLLDESVLKEFLYLFSRERLISSTKSTTDKLYELKRNAQIAIEDNKHILEKIHESLKKFDGLAFIDPEFLCSIKPFNILEEHVWHFKKGQLFTLNPDIGIMLQAIVYSEADIYFNDDYSKALKKANVSEPTAKLKYIFDRLKDCLVAEICSPKNIIQFRRRAARNMGFSLRHFYQTDDSELVIASTTFGLNDVTCDCINCRYRKLDLKTFIQQIRKSPIENRTTPIEDAYGEYLIGTDDFKKAYYIYKEADIKLLDSGKDKISYFISKINQIRLHNLVEGYGDHSVKEILDDIKTIDLDRTIHNELDIYVDNDVRKYLIEIKENKLFLKITENIKTIVGQLEESKGEIGDLNELGRQYNQLYSQFHKNFLVFDAFEKFKSLASSVVGGIFIGYNAKCSQITEFPGFFLTEAILYVDSKKLFNWLETANAFKISPKDTAEIIEQAIKLLSSYYQDFSFGIIKDPVFSSQLMNYHFKEKYRHIINNLFLILTKITIHNFQKERLSMVLLNFLKTEDFLFHFDLVPIGDFLKRHGDIFKPHLIHNLLQIAIDHDHYGKAKYDSFIQSLSTAYRVFYPNQFITDKSIIKRAIANGTHETGRTSIRHLIPLYPIVNAENQQLLLECFEQDIRNHFDEFFYFNLIQNKVIEWDYKDFFKLYIDNINKTKGLGFVGLKEGKPEYKSLGMINLIYRIYLHDIPEDKDELRSILNLSDFEKWALSPGKFDENNFNAEWLLAINQDFILAKLRGFPYIKERLSFYLKMNFNKDLALIYFKYFS